MKSERRKALSDALEGAIRDGTSVRLGTEMCRELYAYLADLERRALVPGPGEDAVEVFKRAIDDLRAQVERAKGGRP